MNKNTFRLFTLFAFFLTGLFAGPAFAQPPDFVQLAEKLKPSVVNISTEHSVKSRVPSLPGPGSPGHEMFEDFFEKFFRGQPRAPQTERALGSGFIISKDGYILTNDHVVEDADKIKVKLSDGREFDGEVRGLDPKLDLALIKIEAGDGLPVAELGDSDSLKVGEWVMAIGNPFGLEQTVTVGIVSAKGRVIGAGPYDNFVQTDASINPGNSGGPLFNIKGEVIGINTAIVAGGQGIGFAIPVNMAKQIIPQLRDVGRVTRGYLGVTIQALTRELADSFGMDEVKGALVNEVMEDSPAAEAGLKRGDIILSFNGQEIEDLNDLPRVVANSPVDEEVKVKIFRKGKVREVKVKVGRLDDGQQARASGPDKAEQSVLGLTVANLTPELAARYSITESRGILVTAIDPEGPAVGANVRIGDLILEVNDQEVSSVKEFEAAVGEPGKGKVVRLLIQRRETLFFTTVENE
jgi:serine protease Do